MFIFGFYVCIYRGAAEKCDVSSRRYVHSVLQNICYSWNGAIAKQAASSNNNVFLLLYVGSDLILTF